MMTVYKITNLINGKIYVGRDSIGRKNYYGSGIIIKRSLKKYGKKNFSKEIIEECGENFKFLCERETYWIKFYNATNSKIGYNIDETGLPFGNNESKRKRIVQLDKDTHDVIRIWESLASAKKALNANVKAACKGRIQICRGFKWIYESDLENKETILRNRELKILQRRLNGNKKVSLARRGRSLSEEHKKNIGKSSKGKNNGMYGKKQSIESIRKREETKKLKRLQDPNYGRFLTNRHLS